jgi:beta-fructofuranosidase
MLELADSWTWDFWVADTGTEYHLFFLRASRALLDPDRRHRRASIGHARSTDLTNWTLMPDALVPSDPEAWDDLATWTGSTVRGGDGRWHMFYTGVSRAENGLRQRIGVATSTDLIRWDKDPGGSIVEADAEWYERLDLNGWHDEAWRDPWVYPDHLGNGWHMLVTARARSGAPDERGVIGHARSRDLRHWKVQPPLSRPGSGFGQLEVPQVELFDDQPTLIFSCMPSHFSATRRRTAATGGVWIAPGDSIYGPFDIASARPLTDDRFYAGRLVRDRSGRWQLLAFRMRDADIGFRGGLADPMPLRVGGVGGLAYVDLSDHLDQRHVRPA